MRAYRVVMGSGAIVDIVAKVMVDDPASSEVFFYQDDGCHHLVAAIRRGEIAGLILGPQKASAIPTHGLLQRPEARSS